MTRCCQRQDSNGSYRFQQTYSNLLDKEKKKKMAQRQTLKHAKVNYTAESMGTKPR